MRALALASVLVLAACGGSHWEETWKDGDGRKVSREVIVSYRGPEHCEWDSAVFLEIGWPLGTPIRPERRRTYVRDPEGLFRRHLRSEFDPKTDLPRDAAATGYHTDDAELWVSPRDVDRAVYLVRGERVERWPLAKNDLACA